ncbi:MAG: hypothetical protein GXP45_07800 [bacterium]|nr:hypothetical protein [bacterium]
MNKHRYQQEILLLCKQGGKDAKQIHKILKKQYPNIGLGTIYRNLNELYKANKIEKIYGIHHKIIYEIKQKNKNNIRGHLVCEHSGKIISIDVQKLKNIDLGLPKDFDLSKVEVIFYGKFKNTDNSCKGKIRLK